GGSANGLFIILKAFWARVSVMYMSHASRAEKSVRDAQAGLPPEPEEESEDEDAEARRVRHRKRLAEPEPQPRRLSVCEEWSLLRALLDRPPYDRDCPRGIQAQPGSRIRARHRATSFAPKDAPPKNIPEIAQQPNADSQVIVVESPLALAPRAG